MSKDIATGEQAMRRRHPLMGRLTRILNPLILGRAGKGSSTFAVIQHQGRRSGRAYTTPVSARPTADGFVVPMSFGQRADWVQNVRAAGGCVIQWKGVAYSVSEPEIIDRAAARSAFSPLERAMLPLIGVEQLVRLRHTSTNGNKPV